MKNIIISLFISFIVTPGYSQNFNRVKEPDALNTLYRRDIRIPDIEGYKTLKCDFHMHTVFSDGIVWPVYRVQEAWYEGLDAIAITDHIEKQPSKKHVGGDQNASYEIAKTEAENLNLILIKAGEITREMPPGHLNALFLKDVASLDKLSPMAAIEEANKQGAFVFWNHPGWDAQQPDTTKWWAEHTTLLNNNHLHGIEVYNWDEWYPIAFDWCNDKNLAYLANSDIHIISSHRFNLQEHDRPMTLVFATEKSHDAIREALFAKRTVARFLHQLAGPEEFLQQLFHASIRVSKPFRYTSDNIAHVEISNPTDLTCILKNNNPVAGAPEEIMLHPGSTVIISCKLENEKVNLPYDVANWHTGTGKVLNVTIPVSN